MQTFIAPRGRIRISLYFSGPLISLWIFMDCCLKTKIKNYIYLYISTCVTAVQWCRLFMRRLWVQICRWAQACSFLPQSVGMNVKLTGECGCGYECCFLSVMALWCPTTHAATFLLEINEDAHLYVFSNFQTWGLVVFFLISCVQIARSANYKRWCELIRRNPAALTSPPSGLAVSVD